MKNFTLVKIQTYYRFIIKVTISLLVLIMHAVNGIAHEDRILVELSINGKPMNFAFDTGASHSLISKESATRNDIQFASNPDLSKKVSSLIGITEQLDVKILDAEFKTQMGVFDLGFDNMKEIDGILSWSIFKKKGVLFFDRSLGGMKIHSSVPFDVSKWKKFKVNRQSLALSFFVGEESNNQVIYIDTGDPSGIALNEPEWKQYRVRAKDSKATMVAYTGLYGTFHASELYWDSSFEFHGIHLKGIEIRRVMDRITETWPGHIATLGFGSLDNLKIMYDGPNDTVYLKENFLTALTPFHNMLGAVFIPTDPKHPNQLLAKVAEGSPAFLAGLRDDDVLIQINKTRYTTKSENMKLIFSGPKFEGPEGKVININVTRDFKPLDFEVVLKRVF